MFQNVKLEISDDDNDKDDLPGMEFEEDLDLLNGKIEYVSDDIVEYPTDDRLNSFLFNSGPWQKGSKSSNKKYRKNKNDYKSQFHSDTENVTKKNKAKNWNRKKQTSKLNKNNSSAKKGMSNKSKGDQQDNTWITVGSKYQILPRGQKLPILKENSRAKHLLSAEPKKPYKKKNQNKKKNKKDSNKLKTKKSPRQFYLARKTATWRGVRPVKAQSFSGFSPKWTNVHLTRSLPSCLSFYYSQATCAPYNYYVPPIY